MVIHRRDIVQQKALAMMVGLAREATTGSSRPPLFSSRAAETRERVNARTERPHRPLRRRVLDVRAPKVRQDPPDHKAQPVRKAQRGRKGLRALARTFCRGAPASKDLRAHTA